MKQRWSRLIVVVSLLALLAPASQPARADLASCNVGLWPHSVAPNTDTGFSFGLYNSDPGPVQWVEITRPAGNLVTLETADAYTWNSNIVGDTATFSGGSLPHGYSQGFSVQAMSRSTPGGPANWGVRISDDPSGANPVSCTDDLSLSVEIQPSVISISNVRVTNVSAKTITVLWDTDVASNSKVDYGPDTSYGSSSSIDSALVTSHSVTLTGLTPNSSYHFSTTSATPADGGTTTSGDNTFLTAVVPAPTQTIVATIINVPGAAVKAVPTETTPPVVTQTSVLNKSYLKAPSISGTATDNDAVASVEYSMDGGGNWLPVDRITPTGRAPRATSAVRFEFTPAVSEDGNYPIVIRATDTSGNHALSSPSLLVIDQLPPQVGGAMVALGANVVVPSAEGTISTLVGADQTVSVSAIGGPVSVGLRARPLFGQGKEQSFTLTQSADTGLWSGAISFQKAGAYEVDAESLDGGGNHAVRHILTANVTLPPTVSDRHTHAPLAGATVSMYALNPSNRQWHLWDGTPYDQKNPQIVDKSATYNYTMPSGTYYMKIQAKGYHTAYSRIFHIDRPTPLNTSVELGQVQGIGIFADRFTIATTIPKLVSKPIGIKTGDTPRQFSLLSLTGKTVQSFDLAGKPTVITMLSTWHPAASEQLPALASVQANSDINVVPVASQQQPGAVRVFLGQSGLGLNMLADPQGVLVDRLGTAALPTHYFLDRTGVVRRVVVGVLSRDELMTYLLKL